MRKKAGKASKELKTKTNKTMNLNRASLIGRVTKDPEVKALPSGKQVARFGVATNYTYKDKDGKKVENVSFHNCVAFGKLAEIIGQYVKKGQEVYLDGDLVIGISTITSYFKDIIFDFGDLTVYFP